MRLQWLDVNGDLGILSIYTSGDVSGVVHRDVNGKAKTTPLVLMTTRGS